MTISSISLTNVSGGLLNLSDFTGGGSLTVSGTFNTANGNNQDRTVTVEAFVNGNWVAVGSGSVPGSSAPANTSGIGWSATITATNLTSGPLANIDGSTVLFRAVIPTQNNPGATTTNSGSGLGVTVDTVADTGVAVNITDVLQGATPEVQYALSGLNTGSTATVTFSGSGGGSVQAILTANGSFTADVSGLTGDVSATVSVTDANGNVVSGTGDSQPGDPVCFYPGTLIATPAGAHPVEALRAGDLVLTADGRQAVVRWMARQAVAIRFADPLKALPIRIRAGALGEGLPARDLLVSPRHALLVEGVLVQAGALVNGTTIARETDVPEVFTYWHVETADHSLILAEGVAAETFVDNVDRERFDNWDEYLALVGQAEPVTEMDLPRAKSHRQVPAAVRARVEARADVLRGKVAAAA